MLLSEELLHILQNAREKIQALQQSEGILASTLTPVHVLDLVMTTLILHERHQS
jgi:hypothetical protein